MKFTLYGVRAICGFAPRPFPRHRWTRQEEVVNLFGLFEGLNRLFSRTFERFCYRLDYRLPHAAHAHRGLDAPLVPIGDGPPDGGEGNDNSGAGNEHVGQMHEAPGDKGWQEKQAQQSHSRKYVLRVSETRADGPLAHIVVFGPTCLNHNAN